MQAGEVIAERFRIERRAGAGGMGAVYRAWDLERCCPVAVKLLHPGQNEHQQERFMREARTLASMRHPAIVAYIAEGEAHGQFYLVMEWLDGHDLSQQLRQTPLAVDAAIRVAIQVADALNAAHVAGVIHRDVKPGNVFLLGGDVDRVKLVDFGVALAQYSLDRITGTGVALGTPSFMAPEQVNGARPVDERADLYSLGATLFASVTGRPPFVGDHLRAVLGKMHWEPAPRLRSLHPAMSRELDTLVAGLLEKDPQHRPQTADEVASWLRRIASGAVSDPQAMAGKPLGVVSSGEQCYVSVLLIASPRLREGAARWPEFDAITHEHKVVLERIDACTVGAVFSPVGDLAATASRAARCAVALRSACGPAACVVATGRGVLKRGLPVGEVIERAVSLLMEDDTLATERDENTGERAGWQPDSVGHERILVDETTAGLLDRQFSIARDRDGRYLLGAGNVTAQVARPLLGRATPFVGRSRELAIIAATLAECIDDGVARATLLIGPAGAGKSRIAHEAKKQLQASNPEVRICSARGDSVHAGSPLAMVRQVVSTAMGLKVQDHPEAQRAAIGERVHRIIDQSQQAERVAVFLAELSGVPFAEERHSQLRAARRDSWLMYDQLLSAWQDWLEAELAAQPVIFLLDDLHWADEPSVRFVDAALRLLDQGPLFVLALARPRVREVFPELWTQRALHTLPLHPLSRRACAAIVKEVLAEPSAAVSLERLIDRSGGNPFYLEELLRSSAAGELGDAPDTVLATVGTRLHALPAAERRVLRAASVFGREFWLDGVAELVGASGDHVRLVLRRLQEREFVCVQPIGRFANEKTYAMAHDLIGEAAYATLTAADRTRAHKRAGYWLDRAGEKDPVVLAEHFYQGREFTRAITWLYRAARQALSANQLQAAIGHAQRAVTLGAEGELLGKLYLVQAEAHNWDFTSSEAHKYARLAVQHLPRDSRTWARALEHWAWACHHQGDSAELAVIAKKLAQTAPSMRYSEYVMALSVCAVSLAYEGDLDAVRALKELVKRGSESADDPQANAAMIMLDMYLVYRQGNLYMACHELQRAIACFARLGDRRRVCLEQLHRGVMLRELGQYESAISLLREAINTAQRLELTSVADMYRCELAIALARGGHRQEVDIGPADPGRNREIPASRRMFENIYRAQCALLDHRLAEALSAIGGAADYLDNAEVPVGTRAFAHAVRSEVLLALDRPSEALRAAEAGMQLVAAGAHMEEGECLLRLVHARALHACGQRAAARDAIGAAHRRLLTRAQQIDDPAWRATFLECVAENRQTVELASAWLDDSADPNG